MFLGEVPEAYKLYSRYFLKILLIITDLAPKLLTLPTLPLSLPSPTAPKLLTLPILPILPRLP